ncbi:basic salivary proline-rich protein 2-like [Calypte anna]|uniref:basic salivary proline-rich protein 2-like n=1 Tax=Calypte anna TaxID=9244 RepID=UPI0011C40961|nr:basic salivary proline-rich protein 2-like [Calypte anna]
MTGTQQGASPPPPRTPPLPPGQGGNSSRRGERGGPHARLGGDRRRSVVKGVVGYPSGLMAGGGRFPEGAVTPPERPSLRGSELC